MIPRLHVDIRVPRPCVEAFGVGLPLPTALRAFGLLPHEAQDVRCRADWEGGGVLVSYSVALTPASLEALHATGETMPKATP
jgi:hypothetical protein